MGWNVHIWILFLYFYGTCGKTFFFQEKLKFFSQGIYCCFWEKKQFLYFFFLQNFVILGKKMKFCPSFSRGSKLRISLEKWLNIAKKWRRQLIGTLWSVVGHKIWLLHQIVEKCSKIFVEKNMMFLAEILHFFWLLLGMNKNFEWFISCQSLLKRLLTLWGEGKGPPPLEFSERYFYSRWVHQNFFTCLRVTL